jgi:hypothetical protein
MKRALVNVAIVVLLLQMAVLPRNAGAQTTCSSATTTVSTDVKIKPALTWITIASLNLTVNAPTDFVLLNVYVNGVGFWSATGNFRIVDQHGAVWATFNNASGLTVCQYGCNALPLTWSPFTTNLQGSYTLSFQGYSTQWPTGALASSVFAPITFSAADLCN